MIKDIRRIKSRFERLEPLQTRSVNDIKFFVAIRKIDIALYIVSPCELWKMVKTSLSPNIGNHIIVLSPDVAYFLSKRFCHRVHARVGVPSYRCSIKWDLSVWERGRAV